MVSVDVETWPDTAGNLDRAGVASTVELRVQDGGAYLAGLPDGASTCSSSTPSGSSTPLVAASGAGAAARWRARRRQRPSHPDEVAPFLALVAADPGLTATTVAVGKGLHLAWKRT